ncbi:hypothetical protein ABLB69_09595 [Xenorhabdus khoisanae]|uniref:hypothetical protein n=1 Tax=Xenorhabdus khoisanae TaxID=880157 RepID=UPI0032B7D2B7
MNPNTQPKLNIDMHSEINVMVDISMGMPHEKKKATPCAALNLFRYRISDIEKLEYSSKHPGLLRDFELPENLR